MAKITQKQELRQQLTPKQILHATLLQLNLPLLEQRILQELENNPALELQEISEDPFEQIEDSNEMEEEIVDNEDVEFEWEELLGEHEDYENPPTANNEESKSTIPIVSEESFSELYLQQLVDTNATKQQLKIAEQVLGNLDTQGYLTIDPILIADRMEISEEDVLSVMFSIQHLDPPGVAARNMQECLIAQAEYRNENSLAITILKNYFNDFANHRYEKIVEKTACSKEELNESMEFIARLNPSPREDRIILTKDTIIPDLIVEDKGGIFEVSINDSVLPAIRLSKTYLNMLESYKKDKEVLRFVKDKVESANWFVDAIKERKQTIQKVMESIIKRQPEYFQSSNRILRPMILQDIANDIDMDISTVSRVTNGKYVQLPWEVKEMKQFFSEGIEKISGERISNKEVKSRLKEIIDNEDKKNPIDDEKLTEILNLEGYKIARRTIAKYREQLKYPIARLRRKI